MEGQGWRGLPWLDMDGSGGPPTSPEVPTSSPQSTQGTSGPRYLSTDEPTTCRRSVPVPSMGQVSVSNVGWEQSYNEHFTKRRSVPKTERRKGPKNRGRHRIILTRTVRTKIGPGQGVRTIGKTCGRKRSHPILTFTMEDTVVSCTLSSGRQDDGTGRRTPFLRSIKLGQGPFRRDRGSLYCTTLCQVPVTGRCRTEVVTPIPTSIHVSIDERTRVDDVTLH